MLRTRTLIALLALLGPAWAGDEANLARYLPASTPVYVETRAPTPEETGRMALYRALQDPEVRALMDRVMGDRDSFTALSVPLGPAGLRMSTDLRSCSLSVKLEYTDAKGMRSFQFRQRFALAWVGLTKGPFPVDLVAGLQVEGDAGEAVVTLRRILAAGSLAMRGEKSGDVDHELGQLFRFDSYRGVAYSTAHLGPVEIHMAPLGPLVVLATSTDRLRDIIDRKLDGGRPSLDQDPRYLETLARAGGGGTAITVMSLQLDRALDALSVRLPRQASEIRAWLATVGLKGLKSLTSVTRVDGEGVSSTTSVVLDGSRRGLGRLFAKDTPAHFGCLDFAPKSTLYAACGTFKPGAIYDMAVEVSGMLVAMGASHFEQRFGLRLKEDLLDLVGPEAALIVATGGGLIPDVGVVCESRDAGRLEASLLKLLKGLPWPQGTGVKSFKIGGSEVHTIQLGHQKLANFPLAPTFGVVGGRLLVALYPLSFQHLSAVQRKQRPGLMENRDFASLRERVPEEALGMSYLDLRRVFELFYGTAIPILQSYSQPSGPKTSPLFELPDAQVFSRHLFGRIAWRTAGENGMTWHSYSSVDTGALALGAIGAGLATVTLMGAPSEGRSEPILAPPVENLEARVCRDRVRLLRARLHLYRREHGKLPANLDALRAPHVKPCTFLVPGVKKPYVYLGPKGRGGVLLYGYPNGADMRISVLTRDFVLERVTGKELQALLASEGAPRDR